jgi:glycosyltransferase involved in cell wall biosynthesis
MNFRSVVKRWYKYGKKRGRLYREALRFAWGKGTFRFRRADLAIFHEFSPPPGGGGNQFLRALWSEFERRGLRVENNLVTHTTCVCLLNSFNFDVDRLRQWPYGHCRIVHRVDGPIGVYRGCDDGTDSHIHHINEEFADITIFQSQYSLQKHRELGLTFKSPYVIMNAVDPRIFYSYRRIEFDRRRKIRLISSSWSDNPNKGAAVYKWLEEHLDWDRFEYTFVGRSQIRFDRIRVMPPITIEQLANLLRQHDIYITASLHESCSNSVLEALSCGLPIVYVESGSNPEIVGEAGLGFSSQEEIPELLNRLIDEYEEHQAKIAVSKLAEVADQYLAVMGLTRKQNS